MKKIWFKIHLNKKKTLIYKYIVFKMTIFDCFDSCHLCDDLLFQQRKTFVTNSLGNIILIYDQIVFQYFFKSYYNAFSNLECQCIQFHIHFMFISSDGMQFYIIYHNLDNDNVCARSAHLYCKLQFSCPILLKSTPIQLHWNPY